MFFLKICEKESYNHQDIDILAGIRILTKWCLFACRSSYCVLTMYVFDLQRHGQ